MPPLAAAAACCPLAASTAFEFVSSIGWGALYLYTPEALPTTIRATGLGACSALSRFAGTVSPSVGQLLVAGGRDPSLPLIIYGLVYLCGAAVATCGLVAETAGKGLADGVASGGGGGGGGGGDGGGGGSAVELAAEDRETTGLIGGQATASDE